jgi:hypothetical protein
MSEQAPDLHPAQHNMAPIVGIGGLLSIKTQWGFYVPLLSTPSSALSPKDRFLPIPDRGLSPISEMYGQLEEQLGVLHERLEERVVLFGHSLGALMATKLALDNPDKISAVECLAGVHDGVDELTFSGRLLKRILGSPDHAEDLLSESDFMTVHRAQMATAWPADVPLHLVSPTHDMLIPAPQGLEVALPEEQGPERLIVVPHAPGLKASIREKTAHLDVSELRWLLPADHVSIAVSPPVIGHTRQLRREVGAEKSAITPQSRIALLPAAA